MLVNDYIGSDYLKAADLGQTTPTITIDKIEPVDFQDGTKKLCIHPADPNMKPIVLNVTNTRACVAAWGPESNNWLGKQCMLSVRQTQMGPGIGVTPMQAQAQHVAAAIAPGAGPTTPEVPFNDPIPY